MSALHVPFWLRTRRMTDNFITVVTVHHFQLEVARSQAVTLHGWQCSCDLVELGIGNWASLIDCA
jgi:hypothetical protein